MFFVPFSNSQASLRIMFWPPLHLLTLAFGGGCLLLFIWLFVAQVAITVPAETVTLTEDGYLEATFSPDVDIEVGQIAYVDLIGQYQDALPATVLGKSNDGLVTLQLDDAEDRLLLLKEEAHIEQLQLVVDQRSPLRLFLPN